MRQVTFPTTAGTCDTLEGPVRYSAGDAIITGEQGEHWPVVRKNFVASYDPVRPTSAGGGGLYTRRAGEGRAVQLPPATSLSRATVSGRLPGQKGDWLLQYPDGSRAIVREDVFDAS